MATISDEVKSFVIAVRVLSRNNPNIEITSDKSRIKLLIEINELLDNKALRKHVLAAITGLPITSQSQLTQASTSTIIDQLVNGRDNVRIIKSIEEAVRKGFAQDPLGFKPQLLYPWER